MPAIPPSIAAWATSRASDAGPKPRSAILAPAAIIARP